MSELVTIQVKGFDFTMPSKYWTTKTNEEIINDFIFVRGVNAQLKLKIQSMDRDEKFYYHKQKEGVDEAELKELLKQHENEKEAYFAARETFINLHEDWYNQVVSLKTFEATDEITAKVRSFVDSINDIDEAFFYFHKTSSMIKEFKKYINSKEENKITKRSIKPEYKEQMKDFEENLHRITGWMGESYYKKMCSVKMVDSYNAKRVYPDIQVSQSVIDNELI